MFHANFTHFLTLTFDWLDQIGHLIALKCTKFYAGFNNNDYSPLRSSEKKLELAKDTPTHFTRGLCSLPIPHENHFHGAALNHNKFENCF